MGSVLLAFRARVCAGVLFVKATNTERTYCIDLTVRQARIMYARDERARERTERYDVVSGRYSHSDTLADHVCKLPSVRGIQYDGMFGPAVYVTVEEPFEQTVQEVKKAIAKYVR